MLDFMKTGFLENLIPLLCGGSLNTAQCHFSSRVELTFRSFRRICFALQHKKLASFGQALRRFVHEALDLCFFVGPTLEDNHNI